jgi:hypothetical protein
LSALSTTYVGPLVKPVKFPSAGWGAVCRIEILGMRAKRDAKTAMKPNWDEALAGDSDSMAGRARSRVTIREPRRSVEFLPILRRHFCFRSSLVIFGHVWSSSIPIPIRKSIRATIFLDRFLPALSRRSQTKADALAKPDLSHRSFSEGGRPPPTAYRHCRPHSRRAPKNGEKKCQIVPNQHLQTRLQRAGP